MDPLKKYKTAAVTTTDTARQLLFVFDEIIKLLYVSRKAIENREYEKKFKFLTQATEVFYSLRAGLDIEKGGELLGLLDKFYISIIDKINHVNMHGDDPVEVDSLIQSISIVRDSIKEKMEKEGEN